MYDYIKGQLVSLNPTQATIETYGVGYRVLISLQTYAAIENSIHQEVKLYLHHHLREDEESLYGFSDTSERNMFEALISVSGIGPGSARIMLSSLSTEELQNAIIGENVAKIKSIKGIGVKTAQRLIIDLKDKIVAGGGKEAIIPMASSPARTEAATALVLLGFNKNSVEKALDHICKNGTDLAVEELIKAALKLL